MILQLFDRSKIPSYYIISFTLNISTLRVYTHLCYTYFINMTTGSSLRKMHIAQIILCILVFKSTVEGYVNEDLVKKGLDQNTINQVFRIVEQIGDYSETVPNLFRVVRKNLEDLEREIKVKTLLPAKDKLEAFRAISEPINRFLRQSPKEYYIHNPPRGTAYKVQLNIAKEVVRNVYRELQTLWLSNV
ncbi:conserved hypothetical protein [Theileria orientalis strain Shintoku]|uniref:Uncharacterized protein n=1 Tax=Theileria orientalis strain Shintoku TaxID=869250 RepID=J4C7L8_THEOR|nr:conserved hypothetical protein [Theileria orientalis strain Shintoku]BAM39263.1 conserved hypothetical protein [Theileria orientalis strain Shintoku]|eukprot:XP_009689564.1 conserved hypothetical protein [Theileria orientalis strain Shintoku]